MESKSTAGSSVSPSSSKPPTNTQDISPSKEKQQSTSKPTVENTNPATTDDSVKPKSKKKSVDKAANAATTAVDSSNATQTANNSTKLKRNKYKYCISSSELDPDAESSSFSDSCGSSLYGPRSNEDRRDYVLWEFLNEQGIWKPYDPLITRLVESQRRKVPVVKLREVDPKMCNIVIDFKAMQQIRLDSGSMRPVRRILYPWDHVTLSQNVMWDWLCESGTWSRYDVDTCAYIEVARLQKKKTVDLYKCSYLPYVINLNGMVQIKKDTGFRRKVRRTVMTNQFPRDGEYDIVDEPVVTETPKLDSQNGSAVDNDSKCGKNGEASAVATAVSSGSSVAATGEQCQSTSGEVADDQPCSSKSCPITTNMPKLENQAKVECSSEKATSSNQSKTGASAKVNNLKETTGTGNGGQSADSDESTTLVQSTSRTINTVCNLTEESNIQQPQTQFEYLQHVFMAPTNVSHLITRAFAYFTALMLAPIVPVLPRTPPIPVYIPPLSSRKNTRRVEGVRKPCSPRKSGRYSQQMDIVLKKFSRKCKKPPEDDCAICLMPLNEFSSVVVNENFSGNVQVESQIYQLKECMHTFHRSCIEELYKNGNRDGSLQCPTCKHVYGVLCGTQPPGSMHFYVIPFSLPGYPECETIQIIYNISAGIQGLEHPSPGNDYTARGFPRKCYLPHNPDGVKVLKLLVIAWERRLIFTIGRSATSGEDNTVIWNDIHHKTEFGSNTTGHGFPDPFYFSNVLSELHAKNITESLLETAATPPLVDSNSHRSTATATASSSRSNNHTEVNNSNTNSCVNNPSSHELAVINTITTTTTSNITSTTTPAPPLDTCNTTAAITTLSETQTTCSSSQNCTSQLTDTTLLSSSSTLSCQSHRQLSGSAITPKSVSHESNQQVELHTCPDSTDIAIGALNDDVTNAAVGVSSHDQPIQHNHGTVDFIGPEIDAIPSSE